MAADDEEREEVLTLVSFRAALLVDNQGLCQAISEEDMFYYLVSFPWPLARAWQFVDAQCVP